MFSHLVKTIILAGWVLFLSGNFSILLHAQQHGKGLILNDEKFDEILRVPPLSRGNFVNLPPKYSLKPFAPEPGNQGSTSTCTAWAAAYSARTMLEALKNPDKKNQVLKNPFSPSFIYNQIRTSADCSGGSSIIDACRTLKDVGVLSLNEFEFDCNKNISKKDSIIALRYRIKDYQELFYSLSKNKALITKKSLSENKPVIIGIKSPPSFDSAGELWKPAKNEYDKQYNGHALAVVGYDDNKFEGAFEILNSWSKSWGKDGFCWIKYSDFESFGSFGIQLIDSLGKGSKYNLSGSITLALDNGERINLEKNNHGLITKKSYKANTLFRLIVNINTPSYFYAISFDSANKINLIFPFSDKISPFIPYNNTSIEIPSENHYFKLDNHKGITSMLLFYSSLPLEIKKIEEQIKNMEGKYDEKLYLMLKNNYDYPDCVYINNEKDDSITFNSVSPFTNVIPLIISILHE